MLHTRQHFVSGSQTGRLADDQKVIEIIDSAGPCPTAAPMGRLFRFSYADVVRLNGVAIVERCE